jgi:Protein of unknown function (DUF1572)
MSNMLITSVSELILRDLSKLKLEISAYQSDETLWAIQGDIKNSSGNLCLHLCGNLQHFIGTVLGKTNYVRNRDAEFSSKGVSRELLFKEIEATTLSVEQSLAKLDPSLLDKNYPIDVLGKATTTAFFLIHLSGHLNYHLGQINYHRRLLDK